MILHVIQWACAGLRDALRAGRIVDQAHAALSALDLALRGLYRYAQ